MSDPFAEMGLEERESLWLPVTEGMDAQRENGLGTRTLKEPLILLHRCFSPAND